ncbi:MAG: hypothetical protein HEQ38_01640 [Gemmatimonas sp.]|nr:hypothetical protein [Gemmatimonas sp.]
MSTGARIAITGTGAAVGDIVRGNDDPVFAYVIANPPPNRDIFDGLTYRRVLGPGQTVVSIAAGAALQAMERAGIDASQVDLLVGAATMGENFAPSALTQVHAYMQLPSTCRVLALNSEYSPFVDGLRVANDMVAAGSVKCALVVAACAWTQHMDYHQGGVCGGLRRGRRRCRDTHRRSGRVRPSRLGERHRLVVVRGLPHGAAPGVGAAVLHAERCTVFARPDGARRGAWCPGREGIRPARTGDRGQAPTGAGRTCTVADCPRSASDLHARGGLLEVEHQSRGLYQHRARLRGHGIGHGGGQSRHLC